MIPPELPKLHPGAQAILTILAGLTQYCTAYKAAFEFEVGSDFVLGPAVLDIVKGMRELLNGPTGSADCGKIDAMIVSLLRSVGFSEDEIN